jgi:hypothetical protein
MLILLLAWIYISFICFAWGNIVINIASRLLKSPAFSFQSETSIIFFVGLSAIGCISMYISLFLPIDWKVQLFFLLITVIYYCFPRSGMQFLEQMRYLRSSITLQGMIFFSLCITLILLINSYAIIHPDTLAYHAQAIRWIEDYATTPGIVHLRRELGFQSFWFVLEALFSFRSSNAPMIFFVGGSVLLWFLIFMIQNLGNPFSRFLNTEKRSQAKGWLVLILLTYCFVSWTQIRLTAASASPDFITSLYILAAGYCFLNAGSNSENYRIYFFISSLCALTAVCIKLSAIVIIILPVLSMLILAYRKWWKISLVILGMLLVVCFPLLIRNYLASGWLLFPSRLLDFFNPDWKFDRHNLLEFQHYINAYARFPVSSSESDKVLAMPLEDWLFPWWQHLIKPDQVIFILLLALILFNLIFIRKFIAKATIYLGMAISVLTVGIIVWFMNAPDPRFVSGFILSLIYCLAIPWQAAFDKLLGNKSTKTFFAYIFLIGILSYCVYRATRFFEPSQIIFPMGISKSGYTSISCGNLRINTVDRDQDDCGSTPVPCTRDSCNSFEPRGNRIEDGFRQKK